jgi:hypothetical protein
MDYITISEASEKWGVTQRAIRYYIEAGRIDGAELKGKVWLIPSSTKKPDDRRKDNRHRPNQDVE